MSGAALADAAVPGLLHADWPTPATVRAFTTLRGPVGASLPPFDRFNLGSRCGDAAEAVVANRNRLEALLPEPPRWLRQVHGVEVAVEPGPDEPEADAAVTRRAGRPLAILTADCLAVLFCSREGDEIAAAHAGWRGLCAGVLERTVSSMHTSPADVLAWLGPAAGPSAYEVGDAVRQAFVAQGDSAAAFTATRAGHWLCDLYALARHRLARAGVHRVFGGGLCTISDPARFYSYRRDPVCGRMASVIVRMPGP